ncbi:MAG: TIR domain-containing protein, partial [Gaiellaceae bacterium]
MGEPSTDVQGRVFISYRRDDTAYPAGWLFDRLAERFGVEQIFKDVDSIELGDDFVEVLDEAVGSTDVLLALIGDKWLTITGDDGRRRLDDPDDFVRLEIEAALKQKVRVIPILVEGAEMPSADELPSSLTPLARRQALELSSSRFTFDTDRLLAVLERTFADARAKETAATSAAPPDELEEPDIPPEPPEPAAWRQRLYERRRLLAAVAGAVVLLAALIGGIVLLGGDDPESTPPPTEEATTQEAPQEDPPPEGPSGDPANGAIAFVSDRSGENEIWTLPPDRSEPIQLTFDFEAGRPDWSPDGTQIVFASDRGNEDGDLDLWILDTEDGSERHLTRGPARDDAADWSPDGTQIAFGRASPGDS